MTAEILSRALLASAGMLLPGLGWAFAARWPLPWLGAGVASALAIFLGIVGAAMAGIPITLANLAAWLVLVGAPGWAWWWRKRRAATPAPSAPTDWWLALPVLPLVAVAAWRAVTQPMWSADAVFRWNRLAELIAGTGRLDFYPPTTTADFALYFWADGMSPLVSGVYAWVYLAMDSTAPVWTALPVLLQVAGLLAVLFALGREWGGGRGGAFACALGGATMLLQFAFNLGQETGATGLGAGLMILALLRWRASGEARLLVPAALGAALAACAREYGIVVGLAGAAWIAATRANLRIALGLLLGAALPAALWHGRVWFLTGNPLYAQSLGGWLPTNPVFDAWMRNYTDLYGGTFRTAAGWLELLRSVALTALPALAGLVAGAIRWRRQPGWGLGLLVTAAVGAAWLASVPFTAGGIFYSLRVLSPVLVLGCAWGGAGLARWVPGRRHLAGVLAGLGLFAADASLRALTIPLNPYSIPAAEWPVAGNRINTDFAARDAEFIRAAARLAGDRVLSDSAGLHRFFAEAGRSYSPLWSPDVAWLFAADDGSDAAARLRDLGFSHVLIKRSEISADFLAKAGVLRRLEGRWRPVMANDTFILFELAASPAPPAR